MAAGHPGPLRGPQATQAAVDSRATVADRVRGDEHRTESCCSPTGIPDAAEIGTNAKREVFDEDGRAHGCRLRARCHRGGAAGESVGNGDECIASESATAPLPRDARDGRDDHRRGPSPGRSSGGTSPMRATPTACSSPSATARPTPTARRPTCASSRPTSPSADRALRERRGAVGGDRSRRRPLRAGHQRTVRRDRALAASLERLTAHSWRAGLATELTARYPARRRLEGTIGVSRRDASCCHSILGATHGRRQSAIRNRPAY